MNNNSKKKIDLQVQGNEINKNFINSKIVQQQSPYNTYSDSAIQIVKKASLNEPILLKLQSQKNTQEKQKKEFQLLKQQQLFINFIKFLLKFKILSKFDQIFLQDFKKDLMSHIKNFSNLSLDYQLDLNIDCLLKLKKVKKKILQQNILSSQQQSFQQSSEEIQVHQGFQCDKCFSNPIIGKRFHCEECDYDLCSLCYLRYQNSPDMHKHQLKLVKIKSNQKKKIQQLFKNPSNLKDIHSNMKLQFKNLAQDWNNFFLGVYPILKQ